MSILIPTHSGPRESVPRAKQWLIRLLVALMLAVPIVFFLFRRLTTYPVPTVNIPWAQQKVTVRAATSGEVRFESTHGSVERKHGVWKLAMQGDAETLGFTHGLLTQRYTNQVSQAFERRLYPSSIGSWRRRQSIRWRLRNVWRFVPEPYLKEVAAFSHATTDLDDDYAEPAFQRAMYAHTIFDLADQHELDSSADVAFAAWSAGTSDYKTMLVGRSTNLVPATVVDGQPMVHSFAGAAGRLPFVSVAWPGMMGVITGVNAGGLFVSINRAQTDGAVPPGIPIVWLLRYVLEHAHSVRDAVRIVEKQPIMATCTLLVAQANPPKAIVIEVSSRQMAVRESPQPYIGVTNHLLTDKFEPDASNDRIRRYTSSDARYRRLMQLVKRHARRMDPKVAVDILRDKRGEDDVELALGNRNALDALIATQGVVVDLVNMMMWIARGPNLLDAFVAIDLKREFFQTSTQPTPATDIPADVLFRSVQWEALQLVNTQFAYAKQLWAADQRIAAIEQFKLAATLAATSPDVQLITGDVLWDAGRYNEAKHYYRQFLTTKPDLLSDIERVRSRLVE